MNTYNTFLSLSEIFYCPSKSFHLQIMRNKFLPTWCLIFSSVNCLEQFRTRATLSTGLLPVQGSMTRCTTSCTTSTSHSSTLKMSAPSLQRQTRCHCLSNAVKMQSVASYLFTFAKQLVAKKLLFLHLVPINVRSI